MAARNKSDGKNNGRGNGPTVVKQESKQDNNKTRAGKANTAPHRWPPGQSGNPNGRPPNPLSMTACYRQISSWEVLGQSSQALLRKLREFFPQLPKKPTHILMLCAKNWLKAYNPLTGDAMSKEITERLDGKVPFPISGPNEGPIPFSLDLGQLPTSDLEQLRKILNKVRQEV